MLGGGGALFARTSLWVEPRAGLSVGAQQTFVGLNCSLSSPKRRAQKSTVLLKGHCHGLGLLVGWPLQPLITEVFLMC